MTYSAPATASHSFRPYQSTASPASAVSNRQYHNAYSYEHDAPQQQAVTYRRRADEMPHYAASKHSVNTNLSAPPAASPASFSPLSLCSSVSSCSSSSSGSSSSAYSSPADTFDLEEMDDDVNGHSVHHSYYQHPQSIHRNHKVPPPPPQHLMAGKPSRSHPLQPHHQPPQDGYYGPQPTAVAPAPHMYGHNQSPPPSMSVSIPTSNGSWKDAPAALPVRRREVPVAPQAHPLLPAEPHMYMPAPMQAVVASVTESSEAKVSAGGKKKKGRSLRRCMDREKHSKAEQKRRGEMKVLFDQLQDISQCVYKDRIHILTLAIQTITRQQENIGELQSQLKANKIKVKAVKRESISEADVAVSSGASSPTMSTTDSVGSKRAAVAAELDSQHVAVKQEDDSMVQSPKKQRTSPHPRDVVDLSHETAFASPSAVPHEQSSSTVSAMATSSYVHKPLHNSFSSSSLSTYVCASADPTTNFFHLMDEQSHAPYHAQPLAEEAVNNKSQMAAHLPNTSYTTQPCVSPVFSFTAHPQHWWPATAESVKQ